MTDGKLNNAAQLHQRVFRYALNLTRSVHIAEELAQECFVRYQQRPISESDSAAIIGYLFRITRNLWIDRLRAKRLPSDSDTQAESLIDHTKEAPWKKLELDEELLHAMEQMMQLPDRQREILYLKTIEDLSISEIAETLSLERGNVKAQLSLARKRLRESLTFLAESQDAP